MRADQPRGGFAPRPGRPSAVPMQTQTQTQTRSYADRPAPLTRAGDLFADYDLGGFHDETVGEDHMPRPACERLCGRIAELAPGDLARRQRAAEAAMRRLGITFSVYGDARGAERIIPFDILPRVIEAAEWDRVERGLIQRITALNLFLADVYGDQRILNDGAVPRVVVESGEGLKRPCVGLTPPRGVWCHVTGTDLVRGGDGTLYVLEDNLRVPSGVSYVLQNRRLMKQTFPALFGDDEIRSVDDYPNKLLECLHWLCGERVADPVAAVLTPGVYNSAYFEHSFLAQQMGIPLVEGRDLVVRDGFVQMRTTSGLRRVDVLYRRIDDEFLDPDAFNKDSLLGVPGLMAAYRAGRIALANAPGTGVADDKVIYTYVPDMIRYYLNEDPILPNVPTHRCGDPDSLKHVLANLAEMVVKPANESGGSGMLIGPASSAKEREEFAAKIRADPRDYIAQPVLALSRVPVLCDSPDGRLNLQGRHVDLRPFIIQGPQPYVLPGGLTRVALTPGSLVVNSSKGGGSKDTWVMS